MKIKLKNLTRLNLSDIERKGDIESLYVTECTGVNTFSILKGIIDTSGYKLNRIRVDRINAYDRFKYIKAVSLMNGFDDSGGNISTPVFMGDYHVSDWVLESEKNDVESKFGANSNLRIFYESGIAYDFGFEYIHFIESEVPDISIRTFDLGDFETIYVGDGSSYYHDQAILRLYKEAWPEYSSKIDTWFNHNINLPSDYTYTPFILSDGKNYLDINQYLGNNNDFLIDASFVLKPTGEYSLYGNAASGFKATQDGLYFTFSVGSSEKSINLEPNNPSFINSDMEAVYRVNLRSKELYKNGTKLSETGGDREIQEGPITLFGNSESVFMGKLYYLKVLEGESMLRKNLIPCYKTQGAEVIPGFYDTVGLVFYSVSTYWCPEVERHLVVEDGYGDFLQTENGDNIII